MRQQDRHWTKEKREPKQVPSDAKSEDAQPKADQADARNNLPKGPTPLTNTLDFSVGFEQQYQPMKVVPLHLCQARKVILAVVVIKPQRTNHKLHCVIGRGRADLVDLLVECERRQHLVHVATDSVDQSVSGLPVNLA